MPAKDAAAIVALRHAIEQLVTRVVEHPETFFPLLDVDRRLVELVKELSTMNYDIPQDDNDEDGKSQGSAWGLRMNAGRGFRGGGGYRGFTQNATPFPRPGNNESYSEDLNYFEEQQSFPGYLKKRVIYICR